MKKLSVICPNCSHKIMLDEDMYQYPENEMECDECEFRFEISDQLNIISISRVNCSSIIAIDGQKNIIVIIALMNTHLIKIIN